MNEGDLVKTKDGNGRIKYIVRYVQDEDDVMVKFSKRVNGKFAHFYRIGDITKLADKGHNICKECGKDFKAKMGNQRYCGAYCSGFMIKCKICGVQHKAKLSTAKYCSDCKKEATNKVRRDSWDKSYGENASKDDLVYLEYKEPLKAIEAGKGYGFYGVVAVSKDRNKVQSHLNGKLYPSINTSHVRRFGLKNLEEYKEKFGLAKETVLAGRETRNKLIENYFKRSKKDAKDRLSRISKSKIIETNKKRRGTKISLESHNKRGNCPDQLIQKIRDLKKEIGRTPSKKDFRNKWKGRFLGTIYETFGSWSKAVELAGFKPLDKEKEEKYNRSSLITYLQNFYQRFGRTPTKSDSADGYIPSIDTYRKYWKTMNAARIQAGVPIVIRMGRHGVAETMDYRNEIDKIAKLEMNFA